MATIPSGNMASERPLPFAQVLVAIGGIYVAQSVVGGLTFQGVPAVLRAHGVGLDMIGLVSVAMAPWAFKFLWAPIVEGYRLPRGTARRSRRIIVAGEMLVAAALVLLGLFGQSGHGTMLTLLGLAALASATIDIACDAFAIEQLPAEQRAWGNVAQVGGSYLGIVFGAGLFTVLTSFAGWAVAAFVMAGLVLAFTLPFALLREPERTGTLAQPHRPSLAFALSRPDMRRGLLLTVVFVAGARLALGMTGPYLIDAGVPLALVGVLGGVGGAVAGLTGTLAGGLAVRRFGTPAGVAAAAILQASILCAFALAVTLELEQPMWLAGLVALQAGALAFGYVALYSLLMGTASLLQAGVDFTLFQCADAFVAGLAGFGGGTLAHHFGYPACFAGAAGLGVIGAFAAGRLAPGLGASDIGKTS